jgi:uncharacterized membrane protein
MRLYNIIVPEGEEMKPHDSQAMVAIREAERIFACVVSFWFAPLVMSVAAILLAWVMYWVDVHIPNEWLQKNRLILAGSVAELRAVLITIATTTLATAGVVFTLLTLPLSTVAAQYGSRLLRVFLGDRITQFVLGMFMATFVYCISAATSIPAAGDSLKRLNRLPRWVCS